MQGFSLFQCRGGRQDLIVDLFASVTFARRVSAAMSVPSFHQACALVLADGHQEGLVKVKQLNDEGLSVAVRGILSPHGEQWVAVAIFSDASVAYETTLLSDAALLERAANSFLRGTDHALPSSRAQNVRLVLSRLAMLLEDGSDPQMWVRCHQNMQHVDRMLAMRHPPLLAQPLSPPSQQSQPEESKEEVAREENFVAEHSWLIAGASIWQLQSDGQVKNRVELYKSGSFARQVAAAAGSRTFRHFCHAMVHRCVRGESLDEACGKQFPVYGRMIKQEKGPTFVCIVVFDGSQTAVTEKFERLNHSLFLAYVASAFAEQSDHRMSKKLGSVRATLKLLDELDNRRDVRSQFVRNVRRKVDRLLNASAELRYSRSLHEAGSVPRFMGGISPPPQQVLSAPEVESVASSAESRSHPHSPSHSLSAPSGYQSPSTPAETAQAQLVNYLLCSNRELSNHNMVLMDQIEALTKELLSCRAIIQRCKCGAPEAVAQSSSSSLRA